MESVSAETNSTDLPSQTFVSQPQVVLSMVILSLTFLLGLPGNGLVLWTAGFKMRRTVNTVWFLNLTLADFLCCLSLPFSLAHLALQGHWPYGWFLCKLIPSIIILNMFASVLLLTAISLDRCLLVLKPVWCQNHRNMRTAFIVCVCIWVVAFLMCIPVFIYREMFCGNNHCFCNYNDDYNRPFDYSLDYSDFNFSFLGNESLDSLVAQVDQQHSLFQQTNDYPWTTDSATVSDQHPYPNRLKPLDVTSSIILRENHPLEDLDPFLSTGVEHSSNASSDYFYNPELYPDFLFDYPARYMLGYVVSTPNGTVSLVRLVLGFLLPAVVMMVCYSLIIFRMRQGRFTKSRRKTLRVAVVVVIVFLLCWAPYHIFGILHLFMDPTTPLGSTLLSWDYVTQALASANSCFNPFLYALLGKDFRKKAKQSMQGILEAAFSDEPTHSTSCTTNKVFLERNSMGTIV
ncbi:C3a anaphylatoxin chemotactic receptor [Erinaceus europaeus]|uniref:C3a anaphylatoxin chemotactic receptor n=1 Tax=Erinaceus europaeus TaxID=9365 RepID=A0A1S3AMC0_ERIEU|nr:C3a anaphylatoxin chemotactic receptor [Erinaceus europaeus]